MNTPYIPLGYGLDRDFLTSQSGSYATDHPDGHSHLLKDNCPGKGLGARTILIHYIYHCLSLEICMTLLTSNIAAHSLEPLTHLRVRARREGLVADKLMPDPSIKQISPDQPSP